MYRLFSSKTLKQIFISLLRESIGIPKDVNERSIEYSFVFMNLNPPPAKLDVGCSGSELPMILATHGYNVYGIDIRDYHIKRPNFVFIKGDIMSTCFPDNFFDIVIAVLTIEHLRLPGRYGIKKDTPQQIN